ncbi:MAG: DUF5688 family protein [Lachnospiraceae bacterium]|nr:DUF5688 family protein [Lachnospiraceae bacterium]
MEFLNAVCDYINETATHVSVSVHQTLKNNGVRLSGLSFSKAGYNAAPTIYMENYYEEYTLGEDVKSIGDRILALYNENDLSVNFDMSFFDDFDRIRDKLYIKLINKEKNTEFLKEAPYEEFLDLAVTAYVRIKDKKIGNGLIMVKNEHLKLWGVTAREVLDIAKKNTHDLDGYDIKHILDVLQEIHGLPQGPADPFEFPMYVATNDRMTNGAAVLTMNDKLKEYAKVIGGDYYVIPSSVHELILVARDAGTDRTCDIDNLIREVNATTLGPDDVLSDHAYLYSSKDEVLIF